MATALALALKVRRNSWFRLLACCAPLFLFGCEPPSSASAPAGAEQQVAHPADLPETLRARDPMAMMNALNSASQAWYMERDTHTLSLYHDLWNQRRDAHPNISWDLVDMPEVRLTIASQLLQASRNGLTSLPEEEEEEVSEMRYLAQLQLTSSNEAVVEKSARVLGLCNREDDVETLLALARRTPSKGGFAAAAEGIASICGQKASDALDGLVNEGRFGEIASTMRSKRSSMARAWCDGA